MKWKIFLCCFLLLATCSCGAKFYAQETSVELYRPDGTMFGKVFSNKGYDEFECKVVVKKNGEQQFTWSAAKVNSDTVANTALEANKELSKTLSNVVGGLLLPVQ